MLSTKHIISSVKDVPSTWIFEHYARLDERLTGQDLKILSLFNPKDRIPSFCIYYKEGKYRFKDFSTGTGGGAIDLVMNLYGIPFAQAANKITEDYNQYILSNGEYKIGEFKKYSRYKVTEFCKRAWNTLDRDYWLSYGIGSGRLEKFWVYPLSFYKMEKDNGTEKKELNINGDYIYGYFRSNGDLYKIYQPKIRDMKFLTIKDYIQGTDQLIYARPNLLIGSSMKDILCFDEFEWPFEVIAPGSENTMIKKEKIELWKQKYNNIIVLFDNDDPGVKAAKKYKSEYGLPNVFLPLEKDLSDSVQKHGREEVMKLLHPQLKEIIKCQK